MLTVGVLYPPGDKPELDALDDDDDVVDLELVTPKGGVGDELAELVERDVLVDATMLAVEL